MVGLCAVLYSSICYGFKYHYYICFISIFFFAHKDDLALLSFMSFVEFL